MVQLKLHRNVNSDAEDSYRPKIFTGIGLHFYTGIGLYALNYNDSKVLAVNKLERYDSNFQINLSEN